MTKTKLADVLRWSVALGTSKNIHGEWLGPTWVEAADTPEEATAKALARTPGAVVKSVRKY